MLPCGRYPDVWGYSQINKPSTWIETLVLLPLECNTNSVCGTVFWGVVEGENVICRSSIVYFTCLMLVFELFSFLLVRCTRTCRTDSEGAEVRGTDDYQGSQSASFAGEYFIRNLILELMLLLMHGGKVAVLGKQIHLEGTEGNCTLKEDSGLEAEVREFNINVLKTVLNEAEAEVE